MSFTDAMHHSRTENSYTARLFEGHLFKQWAADPASIQPFLNFLVQSSQDNYTYLVNEHSSTGIRPWQPTYIKDLRYKDGMVFVDGLDVFSYYMNSTPPVSLSTAGDNTEFDCMIVCEDSSGEEHLISIETKCFTRLTDQKVLLEIKRQNDWLQRYKANSIVKSVHHFGLIAYYDLTSKSPIWKNNQSYSNCVDGLYLVTWRDMQPYFPANRTINTSLPRSIKKIGTPSKSISLI